ncbi:MAG: ABC transporter ATP-binding protein [Oligoflexia bacterium]|nr:ABC transporter ATP-binding protein [Oligoflexia bacterium]
MSEVIISARKIRKVYSIKEKSSVRELEVLKGLDLDINRGEAICIMGASGTGKSTLLHILSSLDKPTTGEVYFLGKNISQMNENELSLLRNKSMGFVFQFHHLLNEFSALENVMMPALVGKLDFMKAKQKALTLLEELGLKERLQHRPSQLSGGECQRVAIARAIIQDPLVVFADEPTGNLDRKTGDQVQRLLFDLCRRRGVTLVAVTHDQEFARWFGKTKVIRDGMWQQ